ncbi:MAG: DegT/DnrJ/EryC1/StrS family aminotransferase [Armatimonadetes bacterium]|nr:DegT/DnrJ/EryC1/StrS family aminotransferase [Armatimonadota bacterium]
MATLALKGGIPVCTAGWPRYPTLGAEEEAAAVRVVRSHNLSAQFGEEVRAFEAEFAAYLGSEHAIAVCNGTAALHTALAAAGVGAGDEVIVPPYTFVATATSVLLQNAIPVFVDIEPRTQGLDPRAVAERITPRTRAIIPVHMNGYPMEIEALMEVARQRNLVVIEDCSHAHGAMVGERKVGTFGQINAFSCQQKKNLSLGEGGLVVTNDAGLAARARGFHSFSAAPLSTNYRLPELHGAIGRVRLSQLDAHNDARIRNARYLDEALFGLPGIQAQRPRPGTKAVYYNYILHIDPEVLGFDKQTFVKALRAEGIPASGGYSPVHRDALFKQRNAYGRGCPFTCPFYAPTEAERPRYDDEAFPVVEELCRSRNVELKIHPPAGPEEMADVATAVRKVVEARAELAA